VKEVIRALAVACALAGALGFTSGAQAVGTGEEEAGLDPDYAGGRQAIAAEDWRAAIRFLNSAALRDTRNPDIQNYLGYAYRNAGELALAFTHYHRALQLNARHRGAHEYLGEAYLMSGNLAKAEEHLALLGRICLIPCDEHGVLAGKIAAYRARAQAK
jgi:Flp pilus assembly protein TadD